jgi:hypothetical protein
MKRLPTTILRTSVTSLLLALGVGSAVATNKTWDGGGVAPFNWATGTNWDLDVAPAANDSLFFDGSTGLAAVNNFGAGTAFNGLTFNAPAGAFVLTGNAITLNGNIADNSTTLQTISVPMTLNASRSIDVVTGGTLAITNSISGIIGFGLTKTGDGALNFTVGQGFFGPLAVNGGTVNFTGGGSLQGSAANVITVNNGGRVLFTHNDTFGNDSTGTGLSVVINAGGLVENTGVYTTLPVVTLNGGTLRANVGNPGSGYEAFQLRVVNVGGTTASTINSTGAGGFNRISLGFGGTFNAVSMWPMRRAAVPRISMSPPSCGIPATARAA